MFVVGPLLKQHRACFNQKSPPECLTVEPPLEPLVSTDVEFGISVYEHWAPAVAEVAGEAVGALASIDGADYLLSQVVQGPGDSALRLNLDPTGARAPRSRARTGIGGDDVRDRGWTGPEGRAAVPPQPRVAARQPQRRPGRGHLRCTR